MSGVVAIFNRDGSPVDPKTASLLMASSPSRARDGQEIWVHGCVLLAHQHFWVTPEEVGEKQPLDDGLGRLLITADVRLDNRVELLKLLKLPARENVKISDTALLLMCYQRWGSKCVEYLLGDFAFIIWDRDKQELFLARDALGARGLCYYEDANFCVVCSEVRQVLAHPAVELRINDDKIASFLAGFSYSHEQTFYENIFYCPPAHCIIINSSRIQKRRYWDINGKARLRYKDDVDYAVHFRNLLTEAIRCRLRSTGKVGISMSGGLDSPSLAAIASGLLVETNLPQDRLKSFSYVFDKLRSCDERHLIRPVVDMYQLDATFMLCDDQWTLKNSEQWPVSKGYVFSDPYAWLPATAMKAAQQAGCRILLAGYYGDVLFMGGSNWAAGMLTDLRLGELINTLVRRSGTIDFRKDLLVNGLRHLIPHHLRMRFGSRHVADLGSIYPGLHPDLVERAQLQSRRLSQSPERVSFGPDQWHRYLSLTTDMFAQGAASTRYQYHEHGLELNTPYWDRRLVEYIMSVPADQLGRPGRDRWLLRNAMQDLLPREVREPRPRTVFLPLMAKGLLIKEKGIVDSLLKDPYIVRYNYVCQEWLRNQLDDGRGWSREKSRYFLWKSLSLELWLRAVNGN